MTMERFREISPNHFNPVDIIIEWKKNCVLLHHGESRTFSVEQSGGRLDCFDESVDKIVLSDVLNIESQLSDILKEAKRVLKKDGRIFIAIEDKPAGINFFSRMRMKFHEKKVIDDIAEVIAEQHLLIDKNFILNGDQIYLEIVKLESDYLKRKIVI